MIWYCYKTYSISVMLIKFVQKHTGSFAFVHHFYIFQLFQILMIMGNLVFPVFWFDNKTEEKQKTATAAE